MRKRIFVLILICVNLLCGCNNNRSSELSPNEMEPTETETTYKEEHPHSPTMDPMPEESALKTESNILDIQYDAEEVTNIENHSPNHSVDQKEPTQEDQLLEPEINLKPTVEIENKLPDDRMAP